MPISTPDKIITPFATSGLKATIPQNSDPINGRAGYDQGFPAINMTPRTAGGIPPFGQDFNGLLFDVTESIQYQQAGGGYVYDSVWATAVGGYPVGARVLRVDGAGYWINQTANNTTDPDSGGVGWVPDYVYGIQAVTMTNANVTLTKAQAAKPIIKITGTLTANLNLLFPDGVAGKWSIINATTGAFTITAKTVSGSGVIVVDTSGIVSDGTNITGQGYGLSLLGANGYQKFSNGLIRQWGTATIPISATSFTVTFPIAFPNLTFGVVALRRSATPAVANDNVCVDNNSLASFVIRPQAADASLARSYTWYCDGY